MPATPGHVPASPCAIVVMGVSGCGKSTLGALLAEALGGPFLEGDSFHSAEAVAKMRGGQALTDEDRWPWLDRLGVAAVEGLREHGVVVVACSALRLAYRDRLREAIDAPVRFVFLAQTRERLLARLGDRSGHYMPASLLDSQLATLEPPEQEHATMTLAVEAPPEALRDTVLDWLRSA